MIQGVRRKSATTEMTLSCGLIFFLRIKDRKDRAGSEVRHRRKMTRGRDKSGRLSTESGELGRGRRQAHSVLERTRFGLVCRWVLEDERTGGMSSCQQSGAGGGGGKDWAGPGQWAGSAWKPMERAWPHARPPRQPPAQASALQGEEQEVPRLGEKAGKGVADDRPGEDERGKERQRTCLLKL